MSDYQNPNIHRGQGISGRGLLIAAVVLVAATFALSFIGTSTVPAGDGLGTQPSIAEPAIQTAPVQLD
jgi:hypothetical protein